MTPLVFTLPSLLRSRYQSRRVELGALVILLTGACFVIFGDLPLIPIRLHVLAFAVLPFVMWGAINFGLGGATLCVFLIAALATVLTAFGSGPFADNTPFVNAALLDVLFAVLAVSGLTLGAVIAERERAETAREQQKRVENALSSVNRKLIAAQEQERTRIGRELHDDIGQRLAMLSVKLAGLAMNTGVGNRPRAGDRAPEAGVRHRAGRSDAVARAAFGKGRDPWRRRQHAFLLQRIRRPAGHRDHVRQR